MLSDVDKAKLTEVQSLVGKAKEIIDEILSRAKRCDTMLLNDASGKCESIRGLTQLKIDEKERPDE